MKGWVAAAIEGNAYPLAITRSCVTFTPEGCKPEAEAHLQRVLCEQGLSVVAGPSFDVEVSAEALAALRAGLAR